MKEYNWREEREKFRPDFQKKAADSGGFAQIQSNLFFPARQRFYRHCGLSAEHLRPVCGF